MFPTRCNIEKQNYRLVLTEHRNKHSSLNEMYKIIVKQIKITESLYNYTESSCEPIYGCLHHKYVLQNCRLCQHWLNKKSQL